MPQPIVRLHLPPSPRAVWAVGAIALLHIVLALMFIVVLAIATDRARAQEPLCSGINLLDRMAVEEPDKLAKIRSDAQTIPNGDGLLWRIEADGLDPSWLYGTMHLSDPRIVGMNAAARTAFETADTVVLELEELQDIARVQAALFANTDLTMLAPDVTLQSLMSAQDLEVVSSVLKERGVPLSLMSRMKPWLIFSMLVIPQCETERRLRGAQPLDAKLAEEAVSGGKRLKGLETLDEQLSTLADLSLDLQVRMLVDIAALGTSHDDRIETMTQLYLDGETGTIMSAMLLNAEDTGMTDSNYYAEFEQNLIGDRNRRMADRLQPMLAEGNTFVAVGALHLPGEDGLVELLRDRGYNVRAVK